MRYKGNTNKKYLNRFLIIFLSLFVAISSIGLTSMVTNAMFDDQTESEEVTSNENQEAKDENQTNGGEEAKDSGKTSVDEEQPDNQTIEPSAAMEITAASSITVNSWDELKAAISNSSIDYITLGSNITRTGVTTATNDLPLVSRKLTIDGAGYTLDFTSIARDGIQLAEATTPQDFTLKNIKVNHGVARTSTSGTVLFLINHSLGESAKSGNWKINVDNVNSTTGEFTWSGLVSAPASEVYLSGNIDWKVSYLLVSGSQYAVRARGVTFMENSDVKLAGYAHVLRIYPHSNSAGVETYINARANSKVDVYSKGTAWDWGQAVVANNSGTTNIFNITMENNAYMHVSSSGGGGDQWGAAFQTFGKAGTTSILSGSVLEVEALGKQSAYMQEILNGTFNVDGEGSKLILTADAGDGSAYSGTLRFRVLGGQTFNITNNGLVKIHKANGNAPGIRFGSGAGNTFRASKGGVVKIENTGDGTVRDPGGENRNQGIVYNAKDYSFYVEDAGSSVEIISPLGAAIDAKGLDNGTIVLGKDASFVARGQTASAAAAIFNTSQTVSVTVDRPLFYDFSNSRPAGGLIFDVGAKSTFKSISSDLAVWKVGTNINGDPYKTWTLIDYSLSGADFATIASTNVPNEFNTTTYGTKGVASYSRMSANNARATVNDIEKVTNADKKVYGYVTIPEGLLGPRPAWTDEVYVKVKETRVNGEVNYYIGVTDQDLDLFDYGMKYGVFVVDLGRYAYPGDSYEVIEAWRGGADPNSPRTHTSLPSDITTKKVSVIDKSPNNPVKITSTLYANGKLINGTWSAGPDYNADNPVSLSATLNGAPLNGTPVLNTDNTWSFTIADGVTLKENDVIQIFLTDGNGNKNPAVDTVYHDATFKAGDKITVKKVLYTITASNAIIGLDKAKSMTTDQDFLDLAKASAIDESTSTSTGLIVKSKGNFKAAEGKYTITFAIAKEPTVEKTVTFEVLPYDIVVTDDVYILTANRAETFVGNAKKIAEDGTYANSELSKLTKVYAFKISDRTIVSTALKSTTVQGAEGSYKATFKLQGVSSTLELTTDISVIKGNAPLLTVDPGFMSIKVGDTFDYKFGVSATDTEDGTLTSKVTTVGTVNTAVPGVYTVEYVVTDSDFNTARFTRVVSVGLVAGTEYIFDLHNYAILKSEMTGSNQEIITNTGVRAWTIKDGLPVATSQLEVRDNGGYRAAVNDYNVKISVKGATDAKDVATAIARVYDRDQKVDGDQYTIAANNLLLTLNQAKAITNNNTLITLAKAEAFKRSDMSAGTVVLESTTFNASKGDYTATFKVSEEQATKITIKIKVVAADNIVDGATYSILANNLVLTKDQAKTVTNNNQLIGLAKAEAFKRKDMSAGTVVLESTTFVAAKGDYTATFKVSQEEATRITIKIKVIDADNIVDGEKYSIYANNVGLTLDQAKAITNNNQLIGLAKAEAFQRSDMSAATVALDSTTFQAKGGDFTATFSVVEEPATKIIVKVKVIDKHQIVEGDEYLIGANNIIFTLDEAKAISNNNAFIALAKAEAFKRKDMSAANVVLDSTNFTAANGDYTATFSVQEEPATKITISIKVVGRDIIVKNDNYAIGANNFTLAKGLVGSYTDADLISWAQANGWDLKTGASSPVQVIDKNIGTDSNVNTYFVEFQLVNDPSLKVKVNVKVTAGSAPELTVTSPIQLNVGDTFNYKDGVTAQDAEDGDLLSKVTSTGTVDTSKKGLYVVTYSVTDADYNTVTKTRIVTVGDFIVGKDYIFDLHNYAILKNEMNGSNQEIITNTQVKAWTVKDGSLVASSELEVRDNGGYKAVEADYAVKISVKGATDAKDVVSATAKVFAKDQKVDGEEYTIAANNILLALSDAKAITDNNQLIALAKAEAFKRSDLSAGTVALDTTDFQAKKGDYTATFKVVEEPATKITVKIKVTNSDIVVDGDKYSIAANNVVLTKAEAKAVKDNKELIALAKAEAYNRKDFTAGTVELESTTFSATKGDYVAVFRVKEEQATKITVKVKVTDSDIVVDGEQYSIAANNVLLTIAQAKAIKDNNELIALAKAEAYKRKDMSAATVKLDSTTFEAKKGDFTAVFSVVEEPATKVTVKVKVVDGDIIVVGDEYILSTSNVLLTLKDAKAIKNNNELIGLANAKAYKRSDLSDATVALQGTTLKTQVGMFTARFNVVEEPTTVSTVGVKVVDNDVVVDGDEYSIAANHVVMTIANAKAITDNNQLIALAKAEAYKRTSGFAAGTVVLDSTTFKAAKGTYKATFSVQEEPATKITVNIKVTDADIIVDGEEYTIAAKNVMLTIDQAKAIKDTDELVGLAKAEAYKRSDMSAGTVALDSTTFEAKGGDFTATFKVVEEPATKVTVKVKVIDKHKIVEGDEYLIGANNIIFTLDEAKAITNNNTFITLAKAEAFKRKDMSAANVVLDSTNFIAANGDYTAIFSVVEEPATKITISIKVVGRDIIVKNDNYAIGANNFSVAKGMLDSYTDADLISWAQAAGWDLKTGSSTPVKVSSKNIGTDTSVDTYFVEFQLVNDASLKVKVNVKVISGNAPTLTVTSPIQLKVGETFNYKDGVSAYDEEDKDLTSKVTSSGTVDTNKKGVYIVTYSVSDSDYNTTKKDRIVVVGDYAIGRDYIFEIYNYAILKNEMNGSNQEIITNTKVKAWSIKDGSLVAASELEVRDNGGYKAVESNYTVKVSVKGATDAKDVVSATAKVFAKDQKVDGEEYTIAANNILLALSDAKAITDNNQLIALAKAEAFKRSDLSAGTVALDTTDFQAKKGDYTATFKVVEEPATKITVKIKVTNSDIVVDGDKYSIAANNVVLTKAEAKAVKDNKELIALAKAEAYNRKDFTAGTVELESTTFSATKGDYVAVFRVKEEQATKITVKVKVTDSDIVVDGEQYSIAANNVLLTIAQAKAIKDNNELIALAKAEAYKRKDMSAATVKLDSTTFEAKKGDFTAVFSVVEEPATKVTVKVKVVDGDIIVVGDEYILSTSNVLLTLKDAKAIKNNNELIGLANAKAYKRSDLSDATVALQGTTLKTQVGMFTARFNVVEEPTTVSTVGVKVVDNDVVVDGDEYSIAANHVVMTIANAKAITDNNQLIALAKAEAYKRTSGFAAGTVVLDSTTFKAAKGTYKATFSVQEEPATKITVNIKVTDADIIVDGEEYTIAAKNVMLTIDQAKAIKDTDELVGLAKAEAYKRSDMSAGTVALDSTTFEAKGGDFTATFKVVEEPATKVTVKVKVIDKHKIVEGDEYLIGANNIIFTLDEAKAITNNNTFITLAKAEAFKRKDMSAANVVLDSTNFTAANGDYTAIFSVVEEPATKITISIKVVGRDIIVKNDNYAIGANNFSVAKGMLDSYTDADLISWAQAAGWDLKTGSSTPVKVSSKNIGTDTAVDTYFVEFQLVNDASLKVKVNVKVMGGNAPTLTVTSPIQLKVGETFNYKNGVSAYDEEDKDLTSKVTSTGTVDTSKKGVYAVTYSVTDSDHNTAHETRVVMVGDFVVGKDYIFEIHNFAILKDEMTGSDQEIITNTGVKAWSVKDGSQVATNQLIVTDRGGYNLASQMMVMASFIQIQSLMDTTDYTVKISVVGATDPRDVASATARVYEKDQKVDGDEYTIAANNIVLTLEQAKAIKDNKELIALANAEAFKRSDLSAGTVELVSTTFVANAGNYEATFKVVEEPATVITVKIKVFGGDIIIDGDEYSIVGSNVILTEDQAKAIDDNNELIALAKVEAVKRKDMSAGTVALDSTTFTATKGEYTATFSVEEEPATKLTVKVKVLANDIVIGDKYAISAGNVVLTAEQAKAIQNNNELIGLAKAEAFKIKDFTAATVALDSTTFKADKGDYTATFSVVEEPATKITVKVKVLGGDIIVIGDKYAISGSNVVLTAAEAKAIKDNKELIALAKAEAYKKSDLSAANVVLDSTTFKADKGDYTATFSVVEEPATKITVKVKVLGGDIIVIGDKYAISGSNVVLTAAEAKAIKDNKELVALAKAEAYKKSDLSAANVVLDSTTFKADKGDYTATFSVVEEPATKITVKVKVLGGDIIVIGDKYAISGSNVVLTAAEAKAIKDNKELIALAKAEAYKKSDLSAANVVLDSTTFKADKGDYTATFSVVEEPATKITVKVKVLGGDIIVIGDKYAISGSNVVLTAAEAKAIKDNKELIALAKAEAYKKSDLSAANVVLDSTTFKADKGDYTATFSVVEEPATKITVKVKVLGGDIIVIGDKYIISASNMALTLDEAKAIKDNKELIALAKAEAYKKSDLSAANVVLDSTTFQATDGNYTATFSVVEEPATKITVAIKVIDRHHIVVGDKYFIAANNLLFTVEEAKAIKDNKELIALAKAEAFSRKDLTAANVVLDSTTFKAEAGDFTATFSVKEEPATKITVTIKVIGKEIINKNDHYAIAANKFTISALQAKTITHEELIALAQAEAWSLKDGKNVAVAVESTTIKDEAGTYEVVFNVVADPTLKITVPVEVTARSVLIEASNFAVSYENGKALTLANVLILANVSLKGDTTDKDFPGLDKVTLDDVQFDAIHAVGLAGGTYDLTLKVKYDGVEYTKVISVKVNPFSRGVTPTPTPTPNNNDTVKASTGDTTNVNSFVQLLILSIFAVVVLKRRKRDEA